MIPSFELDILKRDLIEGLASAVFLEKVRNYIVRIEAVIDLANERGVLITHLEPVEFSAAFFASVHSGVPVILANPKWQRSEWEQFGEQVNPAIVFGASDISEVKTSTPGKLQPGTILIPTGGSSGSFKLAVHTWGTLKAAVDGFHAFLGHGPIHSCCALPLYHVSGLMQLMRSFISGGRIVFINYRTLQDGQIPEIATQNLCLSLVPTQLERLIGQVSVLDWLRSLKAIFLGGAPMSLSLQAKTRELRLPVIPTYGMTETAAMVTALSVNDFLSGKLGVGYPLKHAKIQVIRKNGSTCLPEEGGRIQIQTRSLCLGYHGLSSDNFRNAYLSQDEGYLDREGCLHIIGRSDRIIISGGEKIDPLEIETAFLKTGMVDQVFATGLPDSEWGELLIAFYVPLHKADGIEALRQQLKATLVNYKIPRRIIQAPQLPLTIQGKPDHALIEELLKKSG